VNAAAPFVFLSNSPICVCFSYFAVQIVGAVIAFILRLGVMSNERNPSSAKKQAAMPFYVPQRQDGDRSGDRSMYVCRLT
jgi:hypothetical protein